MGRRVKDTTYTGKQQVSTFTKLLLPPFHSATRWHQISFILCRAVYTSCAVLGQCSFDHSDGLRFRFLASWFYYNIFSCWLQILPCKWKKKFQLSSRYPCILPTFLTRVTAFEFIKLLTIMEPLKEKQIPTT